MSTSRNNSRLRASHSRPRALRHASTASVPYLPQPAESILIPEGAVGEEATELLQDLIRPHRHEGEDTLIEEEDRGEILDERAARAKLPWWKRPSHMWLLVVLPFSTLAMGATIAPKIEIYTVLACSVHKPEYTIHLDLSRQLGLPYIENHDGLPSVLPPIQVSHTSSFIPSSLEATRNSPILQFASHPKTSDNETEGDKKNPNRCASDPEVQAAVAKLTAVMTASMGVLACLTTAWWGSFSDRHGRLRVMGISIMGVLLTDANFIFVSKYSTKVPGGYWFLILGPLVEGSLGGMTAGAAAMHAYIADVTDPGARSRIFSLYLGLVFIGIAIGPTFGSVLIRVTQNILSVFYAAFIAHATYAIMVWFIIPESVSHSQKQASRLRHKDELEQLKQARDGVATGLLVRFKRLFSFLTPLVIFLPKEIEGQKAGRRKDWNLTLVAAASGCTVMVMGSYPYKFQYALATFHWTSEYIGYYLSIVGASRAVFLTVLLPVAIKLCKPKEPHIELTDDGDAPVASTREHHSPSFDIKLAQISLAIEIVSFTAMSLTTNPMLFTVYTVVAGFGGGFSPALQSVALDLFTKQGGIETGRLFGALSVVSALCSQVLGPAVFGFTYIRTVRVFPAAIFYLSSVAVFMSMILLSFVRLRKERHEDVSGISDVEDQTAGAMPIAREETLVDLDPEAQDVEANLRGTKPKVDHANTTQLVEV